MINSFKAIIVVGGFMIGFTEAHANSACDINSLEGQYAFKAQGETVGVFDTSGTLHPLASPQLISSIGQFTFDGQGGFTRIDFAVNNGVPAASPMLTEDGFRTGQTGSYTVASDCTGIITLEVPGGTEIVFAVALVDYGQSVYGVVKSEHIPGLPPAVVPTGAACDAGCNIGVNLAIDLTKNSSRRR
jgi:hypothetical protein